MITTLDAQPQEWMEGKEGVFHTIAACHFDSIEHIEHWVEKLVPKNRLGAFVKWSGGRRKVETRDQFIEDCFKYASEIDFSVNCVSTSEGEMSWFAWAFYMQNRQHVTQELDAKGRNCLVFGIDEGKSLRFPVLRAGYLIWYHHVIRYLAEALKIRGMLLSDNFANDEEGPGEGRALGVSFVNFLLAQGKSEIRVSLPTTERYKSCDSLSDYFCGWVNSVRSGTATEFQKRKLSEIKALPKAFLDSVTFATNLNIVDEHGKDVTAAVKALVASVSGQQTAPRDRVKKRGA